MSPFGLALSEIEAIAKVSCDNEDLMVAVKAALNVIRETSYDTSIITDKREVFEFEEDEVGDLVVISLILQDDCPFEYEFPEGVKFETFQSMEARQGRKREWEGDGLLCYAVWEYRHGISMFSLAKICQWDSAPSSLIGIPIAVNAFTDPKAAAEAILKEYTCYVSGQCYGVRHVILDRFTGNILEEDDCWGYYGSEYAEEVLKEGHGRYMDIARGEEEVVAADALITSESTVTA